MIMPRHYKRLKRGPQVILPKDIGIIIAYAGVNRDSVCVDAGAGSGWLAISLARVAKEVTSYEVRDDFLRIAQRNKEAEGLNNLSFKKGDVRKGISERDVDVVTLDMPDSDEAVGSACDALRPGGYIVGYMPHTEQVKKFVDALGGRFTDVLVVEAILRDMLVREQGVRPSTKGVWHTGYIVFARKSDE
jgi:tRNA (adenine57-N1/adenine58-N1)-methyltransferase